jgi:hypothetical protein
VADGSRSKQRRDRRLRGAIVAAPIFNAAATLVVASIAFLLGAAVAVRGIRRRHLVVDDTGITARRNSYELRAAWDDLATFETGRFAFVVPITLLRLHRGTVVCQAGQTMTERRMTKIRKAGADRCIQISVYVEHHGAGRFGELLRQHRPDLAQHT